MYKIYDKIIKFIEEAIKNWRVELSAWGNSLAGVKLEWNALSSLLFVKAMMLVNHIYR